MVSTFDLGGVLCESRREFKFADHLDWDFGAGGGRRLVLVEEALSSLQPELPEVAVDD